MEYYYEPLTYGRINYPSIRNPEKKKVLKSVCICCSFIVFLILTISIYIYRCNEEYLPGDSSYGS